MLLPTLSRAPGRRHLLGFVLTALLPVIGAWKAGADQLRYDSAAEWSEWQLPLGALDLTPGGQIEPIRIRKDIDAIANTADFGGGIRDAGSARASAALIMDGDASTGWAPDAGSSVDDWFVEIDLGRGVSANSVTLVFDEAAPPFEIFDLLLSTGEPETDFIAAPIEGSIVYRLKERFKANDRHRVTYVIEQSDYAPIKFVRVELKALVPGARLADIEVETIGDNIALGLLNRGGTVNINTNLESNSPQPLGNALALIDGDFYKRWRTPVSSRGAADITAHMILDLGAVYWLDQVRIVGGVVVRSGFSGGITTNHYVSRRRWGFRFYELMTSDGSLSPDGSRIYTKHFSGVAPESERVRGVVDHTFDPIATRYVRIFWKFWDISCSELVFLGEGVKAITAMGCTADGGTDEIQIFGAGFPKEVHFQSPLIDMRGDRNLNTIEWDGAAPAGTRVEIRSRTGNEVLDVYVFHDKTGKTVTEKKWNKLIPSFRGTVDTLVSPGSDWSPWSKLYLEPGQEFHSPSPRRYLELDVKLVTDDPDVAPTLDYLAVNHTPPLARQVVGEIHPLQAQPGVPTEFSYFLRPQGTRTAGFDRVVIEATAPVRFTSASIDGALVTAQVETTASGFQATFDRAIHSDQLVELGFESSVFLHSTRYDAFLEDSGIGNDVRQRVDPGDASELIEGNTNVVALPVNGNLLASVELNSTAITPNGDDVNDELVIRIDLVNVLEARPLVMVLYDLAGNVRYREEQAGSAGEIDFRWDGRASAGQTLLPPGVYVLEVRISADAGDESVRRLVSVAY